MSSKEQLVTVVALHFFPPKGDFWTEILCLVRVINIHSLSVCKYEATLKRSRYLRYCKISFRSLEK